jgi:hypothetical protein
VDAFWVAFWRICGIVLMTIGVFALYKTAQLSWLARCTVSDEQQELRLLSRIWMRDTIFFLIVGFFVYNSAPTTARLFSVPLVSIAVATVLVYLTFRWLRMRLRYHEGK